MKCKAMKKIICAGRNYAAVFVIVFALVCAVLPCHTANSAGMKKTARSKVTLISRTASTAQVKWTKIKGAAGYQIKFAIAGKRTVKKNLAKSKKKFLIYLSANEQTKVYVRGFRTSGGHKVFSKWSKKLSISKYKNDTKRKEGYQFRTAQLLAEHFQKHGSELGYSSAEKYLAGANRVISSPSALRKKEAEDGDDVYFLESTGELVIVSTDGFIRTYFKPEDGKKYFDRQ